jgi:hypothetical protein
MRRGIVVEVGAALALLAGEAAAQDDGSSREWNQPHANAARTGCVDVAPIRSVPQIVWRTELPGAPVSSPVAWDGVVFVSTKNAKGDVALSAVRAATGETIVTRALGKVEWADVAVLRGNVVVVDPEQARCLRFDGKQFSLGWTSKGAWSGQPAVSHGVLLLADATSVHLLDPASGRDVLPPVLENAPTDCAATCAVDRGGDEVEIARLTGVSSVSSVSVKGFGTKKPSIAWPSTVKSPFLPANLRGDRGATLVQFDRLWFATSPSDFTSGGGGGTFGSILLDGSGRGFTMPVDRPVAVVGKSAYGTANTGMAYSLGADGAYVELTRFGSLPKGAGAAAASASRGVVYFGNWAMELASGRVLWSLPDVAPVTPLVPVGDGRGVVVDVEHRLVGIAEPAAARAPQTVGAAPPGEGAADELPGDADGVLLADGRFVAGDASAGADGRLTTRSSKGEPREFGPDAWVLAQRAGAPSAVNEERRVLATLEDLLDRRSVTAWDAAFRKYADVPLVTDALRVLALAKKDGISDEHARQLEQLVAGKHDHPNADLQRKRIAPEEQRLRDGFLADVRSASAWCRARGLLGTAAALLARVRAERPGDATVEPAARGLLPAGFPWAGAPDAGARWIDWAVQIVPAGGAFVAPDAPDAKKRRSAPWESNVVLLRTRNVLLVSRSSDPLVVGACLRHAEGAIRACESVLGPASRAAADRVLEVRLHRDRAEYLAEVTPDGRRTMEWSAGYYSPSMRVSRFYVPDARQSAVSPLERRLLSVLAHELTHQWIDLRWAPGDDADVSSFGFWCVEGVARFIEDQSVEMGRREGRLDDATVESLDVASQIEAGGGLMPLATLLPMSQEAFLAIADGPQRNVALRNAARTLLVDPRGLFYEQSGSLVFWLVNQRGAAGRAAFAAYLRLRYRGQAPADPATALGFASEQEMEREFRKFLAGLRQ